MSLLLPSALGRLVAQLCRECSFLRANLNVVQTHPRKFIKENKHGFNRYG